MTFLLLLAAGIVVLDVLLSRPAPARAEPIDLSPLLERRNKQED